MSDPMLTQGTDKCKCSVCGEYFKTSTLFEFHRVGSFGKTIRDPGTRRCLTVQEMTKKKLKKNREGYWVRNTL